MSNDLTVLMVLGMVGVAYLLTHFVVEWFQRRALVVSGLEYILLGVVLGPVYVSEVQALADHTALAPVIAFAAGWVGLLYGMELELRKFVGTSNRSVRLALVEVALIVTSVTWVAHEAFVAGWLIAPVGGSDAWVAAGVLGCAAAAGSSSAVDLVAARYANIKTETLPMLRRAARIGDLLAITCFGTIFCLFHEGTTLTQRALVPAEWLLITVALGGILGVLFMVFLGRESDPNDRFLALSGILLLASGSAFFLNLSALLVNLLLGILIVNMRHGATVPATLERTSGPVRLVLLVFAGAMWEPVPFGAAVGLAGGYILLRGAAKIASGAVASLGTPLRGDIARGMISQGEVAVAMAISAKLIYSGPAIDLAYTAILVSVVLHELIAPRLLKGLLVDSGELRHDVEPSAVPTSAVGG